MSRVAFYAPLKAPDHPVPSGERTMARLLLRALAAAGFAPDLASRLRTRDADGTRHPGLKAESLAEAERLVAAYRADPPALWFTYHVYYKAPDWIGPAVSRALGIPYVVAEGSRAPRRAHGPHALGHAGAEAALDAADLILVMNRRDRPALEAARPRGQVLAELPPFLDPGDWLLPVQPCSVDEPSRDRRGISSPRGRGEGCVPVQGTQRGAAEGEGEFPEESHPSRPPRSGFACAHFIDDKVDEALSPPAGRGETPRLVLPRTALSIANSPAPLRLLTVAMMREGDKLASYRLLAEALAQLGDRSWTLDVAGDGPAAAEVASLLAPFGDRVRRHGTVAPAGLSALYAAADLLVWPAVNEAYGMALLEAQAHGCPVVAGGYGGVPDVVRDGVTGRVTPPGDVSAFTAAIRDLAGAPGTLAAMQGAALAFAREERGLIAAAARLRAALGPLLRERA
ncbi:glycosyltransferase family 4 protein [Methylobacterium sp. SyP6R]|uniref:glycosyltransferase family 4 protein n=1 Tax=Methylobacterium sp. SyP6R TaxID=2718876 RepID=UPI001F33A9AE|nr:glycosyltransferase family 4 protein [Methylobacterium sp. SyP6R]MCF4125632.1 glycosyltransferase family 4 protein [Methylobacterium sp. SyP6R]